MKILLVVALSLTGLVLLSCQDDEEPDFSLADGTYTGVFYRSSPTTKWAGSSVVITFDDGTFNGGSDSVKYPAICEGTYKKVGLSSVEFASSCVWTADFDWSFILSGRYKIDYVDDELVMTQLVGDQSYNTYRLRRE